jgi:uncharacterized NAD(P)/FAD-binding protein YdhS
MKRTPTSLGAVVAVIGGGFSGLLTALHLLRIDPGLTVRLVERAPRFGRGRAYATASPDHLLNVRASNMSAFADRPDHFQAWLAQRGERRDAFVSRRLYGDYLQELLRETVRAPEQAGRLLLEADEVRALRPTGRRYRIELALGRSFEADAVVLATGLSSPAAPAAVGAEARQSPGYVADPWSYDLQRLPRGEILLLGTGLTMVDAALELATEGRRVTALSRRGLQSRAHAPTVAAAPPRGLPASLAQTLHVMRTHARAVGWREAVDSIRGEAPAIWRAWSLAERRRFLRHLRPWWDVHRHRMAPTVGARITALQAAGDLTVLAGELIALRPAAGGFEAEIRLRNSRAAARQSYAAVVNCTGLSGDLAADRSGLFADLVAGGLAARDPLGLGLDVDTSFRLRDAAGRPTPGLYAVGPLTRAAFWESVAIPDLRSQTSALARMVAQELTERGARAGVEAEVASDPG